MDLPPLARDLIDMGYANAKHHLETQYPKAWKAEYGSLKTVLTMPKLRLAFKWPKLFVTARISFWKERDIYQKLVASYPQLVVPHVWGTEGCVAEYVHPLSKTYKLSKQTERQYHQVADTLIRFGIGDIHEGNFGLDLQGRVKLLDIGGLLLRRAV